MPTKKTRFRKIQITIKVERALHSITGWFCSFPCLPVVGELCSSKDELRSNLAARPLFGAGLLC